MKKFLSLFLSLVMLMSITAGLDLTAFANEETDLYTYGDYQYYMIGDNNLELVSYVGTESEITIPSVVEYYTVTRIGDYAFYECTDLTSITIPDSVTAINSYAFYGCENLESVTIGNSVTIIEKDAFAYCTSLTSITIPDSVKNIGNYIFEYCTGLTSVTIGNNVTDIGKCAFQYCTGLKSITIPDSVESIGSGIFLRCTNLENAVIGNGVTSIGDSAFLGCSNLTNVTIGNSVKGSIGALTFYECSSLTSVNIPSGVTSIGINAFYFCTSLTSITIPNSVTTIGGAAFNCCTKLTSIDISDNVTSIGDIAFCQCTSLTAITVSSDNEKYASDDGVLFNKDKTELICYPAGKTDNTSYTIPNTVTSIANSAFHYCRNLESIIVPDSVTIIGDSAFYYCPSLTCIAILNPDCEIYDSSSTIYFGTIHADENSTAQAYAEKYDRTFETHTYEYATDENNQHYGTCTVCGATTEPEDHTEAEAVAENEVAATCTDDGSYDSVIYCSVCGEELSRTTETISATGHSYTSVVTAPTCTTDGYTTYTCSVCGYTYTADTVSATGHTYDSGVITTAPTCTTAGVKTYTCSVCGATKTETISTSGHIAGSAQTENLVPATQSENGSYNLVTYCTVCGEAIDTQTVEISKIASITLSKTAYIYNGKMRKPTVTVKDGNGNEISSEYYTVTYASGRKNVGKYKVTVKFSGNYSGTKTLYFKIKPVSTKLTSVDISKKNIVVKWEKKTKQVTGYQIQLSTTKKFKKGTTVTFTNKNSKKTKFTLKGAASVSGKTYYVRIRTYKTVNGSKIYSGWSTAKKVTTK